MLFLPVGCARLDGIAGLQAFERDGIQLIVAQLIGSKQPFKVSFDGKALGFGAVTNFGLELGTDGKTHGSFLFFACVLFLPQTVRWGFRTRCSGRAPERKERKLRSDVVGLPQRGGPSMLGVN